VLNGRVSFVPTGVLKSACARSGCYESSPSSHHVDRTMAQRPPPRRSGWNQHCGNMATIGPAGLVGVAGRASSERSVSTLACTSK
jgi:hypothetical protein